MSDYPPRYHPGDRLIVVSDCTCEHSKHEHFFYPRPGIELMYLKVGDVVTVINEWTNFVGCSYYVRVTKDDSDYEYDICMDGNHFGPLLETKVSYRQLHGM